jgi:hypothetical protein
MRVACYVDGFNFYHPIHRRFPQELCPTPARSLSLGSMVDFDTREQAAKALLAGLGFELGREGTRYVCRDRRQMLGMPGALQPITSGSIGSLLALFDLELRSAPRLEAEDINTKEAREAPRVPGWIDRNSQDPETET